jgi:hypothetical protein
MKKTDYDRIVPPRFLYRYRPLHDEFSSLRQMLEQDRWWFGSRAKFDDPEDMISPVYDFPDPELAKRARKANQDFMDNTGVLCLSISARQPRLWAEYAADGKGVCIQLESDYIVDPDHGPFRVNYCDVPKPSWKPFQDNRAPLVYLLQKKRVWSYQGEWRCILKWNPGDSPTVGYRSMWHKRALAGLIFGWNTTREERAEVIGWLKNGGARWLRRVNFPGQSKLSMQEARVNGGSIELSGYRPEEDAK